MKQKQIGFEFEIGSPWGLRKTCNKMKEDLNLPDLKIQHDVTVDTHARYNGEIITPIWPFAKGFSNLKRIFRWFEKNDIVTDSSCGLHVNISFKNKALNWMIDPTTLILCFNEEKWLKICKRQNNTYTDCYIDELIIHTPRKSFTDEDKALHWVENKIEECVEERFHTINLEHLETDNPYVEYRCLGGVGYHLRFPMMAKAIVEMAKNLERALPDAKGTGFKTKKIRQCFFPKKNMVPH